MNKYLNTVTCGDGLEVLKDLPDASINCVITSPPYWQLRDYGFPEQWGLEPTYQEYLEHLWSLMDEIFRVLKDDGTVWINLGDSYGTTSGGSNQLARGNKTQYGQINHDNRFAEQNKTKDLHKCLLLIPHRFGIGCIDRGWIVRNDIIWAKRNGMPESVTDRFSKKHEYIFLMVKNQKYYFDLDGVRDKIKPESHLRYKGTYSDNYAADAKTSMTHKKRDNQREFNPLGKNPGSVSDFWDIPTQPSSEKHYASFNTDLIDKPIIAGCPKDGIILDPFCGTGTTLIRALQLNRRFIGIDGSKDYCEIANKRIKDELDQLKFQYDQ